MLHGQKDMQEPDGHLLTRFATHRDEAAFGELTTRYLGLIYHVALRRTGNRQMAEEVSQNVLCAVVRKAAGLARHPDRLSAWLHRATLFESSKAMRSEASHQRRKQLLHPDQIVPTDDDEACAWNASLPLLDLALDRLPDADRSLVLLHYFEGKSFTRISGETGRPAPTVQKQCRRALDKLARVLRGKGVMLSGATLASGLATQSAKAAPAALMKTASAKALAGASAYSTTSLTILMATKSKAALPIALLVLISPLAFQQIAISSAASHNERLRHALASTEPALRRAPDKEGTEIVRTGKRKITIDLLQRTLQQADRSFSKRIEFDEMLASLGAAELEALIPRTFTLAVARPEKSNLFRHLVEALAKMDHGSAVRAACTPSINEFSSETIVREALFSWASTRPDEAIDWLRDMTARHHDDTGLDLLPFKAAVTRALILAGSPRVREVLIAQDQVNPAYILRDAVESHRMTSAGTEDPDSAVERFLKFLPWIREVVPEKSSAQSGYADRAQVIGKLLHETRSGLMPWENPVTGRIMESDLLLSGERRIIAEYQALRILEATYNTTPARDPMEMEAAARNWLGSHIPEAAEEIFGHSKSLVVERVRQRIVQDLRNLADRADVRDNDITQVLDHHHFASFTEFLPQAIEQAARIKDSKTRADAMNRLHPPTRPGKP